MADQGVDAKAIRAAVELFSARMAADPALSAVFATAGYPDLRAHQRGFLLALVGRALDRGEAATEAAAAS